MKGHQKMLVVNTDLVAGGFLVAIGVVALLAARGATFNVWIFPRVTASVLALIGSGLLVKGLTAPDRREVIDRHAAWTTVLPFAVGLILYGVLFSRAGFVPTTIVFYSAATWVLRRQFTFRSAAVSLLIGTAFTLCLYQLFTRAFYVPLPSGTFWVGW
jgi:hypothetical protein